MTERDGPAGLSAVTDDKTFELIAMCRERAWKLVADREAMVKGLDRFVLTMGETEAEGGGEGGFEGERGCERVVSMPCRRRCGVVALPPVSVRGCRFFFVCAVCFRSREFSTGVPKAKVPLATRKRSQFENTYELYSRVY